MRRAEGAVGVVEAVEAAVAVAEGRHQWRRRTERDAQCGASSHFTLERR